jgi:Sulfatase-modifying factor enzyme 1
MNLSTSSSRAETSICCAPFLTISSSWLRTSTAASLPDTLVFTAYPSCPCGRSSATSSTERIRRLSISPPNTTFDNTSACRAGSPHAYCWGEEPGPLAEFAWFEENSGDRPHSVGTLRSNRWGLYDMLGNVDERVGADLYSSYDEGESERLGVRVFARSWALGETVRGGYYDISATACRCGFMVLRSQATGGSGGGFRPAATFPAKD